MTELPGIEKSDVVLFFNYVEVFGVRLYRPDRVSLKTWEIFWKLVQGLIK